MKIILLCECKYSLNVNAMRLPLLISLTLCFLFGSAQEFMLKHLDTSNGLANNKINAFHRDSDGFLWVGTSSGLCRYNGYGFKIYLPAVEDSVMISYDEDITDIQEDRKGRLWVRSGKTYLIYDPVSDCLSTDLSPILKEYNMQSAPSQIHFDSGKNAWIHINNEGLYRIKSGSGKAELLKDKSFAGDEITDIVSIPDEVMTIDNHGVIKFISPQSMLVTRTDSLIAVNTDPSTTFVYTIVPDNDGLAWIFSNEKLWLYDTRSHTWANHLLPDDRNQKVVKTFMHDSSGIRWIARDHNGLEKVVRENDRFRFIPVTTSVSSGIRNTVTALYDDNAGSLWIGTYKKGIYYHNESANKFKLIPFPDVNCLYPSLIDGSVWIGTDAAGIIKWNPQTNSRTPIPYLTDNGSHPAITTMLELPDGTLYFGSFARGLRRCRNGKIETLSTGTTLDNAYTWALAKAPDGKIWIGTLGHGLYRFDPKSLEVKSYNMSNSDLFSDYILDIARDGEGERRIYIATSSGVAVFDPIKEKFSSIPLLDGLKINDLLHDTRDLLWVASTRGLHIYDPHRERIIPLKTSPDKATPDFILGLQIDNNGNVWASEGGNLVKFNVRYNDKTGEFSYTTHRYDSADGLQNCDFNQRSFGRLPSGQIFIGSLYGLNEFNPDSIRHNRALPNVMFSDISVGSKTIRVGENVKGHVLLKSSPNHGGTLELWPDNSSFSVTFATDNYIFPEKTTYQHKLEGLDDEWMTTPPGVHMASYTNLAPGTYRLLVKAVNNDGYESVSAAELTIIMHPPFWLSVWAKLLYALILCLLVYAFIRHIKLRERRRFNEKRKEDALVKQEEINQLKFKFYTNVSHELRTPLTLIVSPLESMIKEATDEKQLKRLTLMRNNAMRLLLLVNQLLDFRKNEVTGLSLQLSEGEIVGFVRGVCHSFANLSERKNIRLTFTSSTPELNAMFDEDKLYKSIMNLLSNAFKFTPEGGEVKTELSTTPTSVIIKVSDTGIGISDSDKPHVFDRFFQADNAKNDSSMTGNGIGLSMVNEYIKLHNGTIEISDNPGGGTIFTISIPLIKQTPLAETTPPVSETVSLPDTEILEAQTEQPSVEKQDDPAASDKPTALVVDDSHDMIEFLRDGLGHDFHVMTAPDGATALRLLESIRPAIVLTDLMMPGIDGLELCRKLKSNQDLASTPVIILTAKHDIGAKVEGLTTGADDYITKPFNIDLLLLKMKKLISLSHRGNGRSLINPEPDTIKITPLDEKMVEKAIKYVVTNIKRPDLSVEELSSHLGMSRVHLYKKLKATTGKTPVEFIRLIRLKRGAQMLRESQLNVSEIAFQLGYNNPKYFSKYFKEEFGVLPSIYQDKEGKATNYHV